MTGLLPATTVMYVLYTAGYTFAHMPGHAGNPNTSYGAINRATSEMRSVRAFSREELEHWVREGASRAANHGSACRTHRVLSASPAPSSERRATA